MIDLTPDVPTADPAAQGRLLLRSADMDPLDYADVDQSLGLFDFDYDPQDDEDTDLIFKNIFNIKGNLSDYDLADWFNSNDTGHGIDKVLEDFTKDFDQTDRVSQRGIYLLCLLYGVVICIGVVGNVIILLAVLTKGVMRTARNSFIAILALSDLLLCTLTMPLKLWDVLSRRWPFGEDLEWLCRLAHSCQGTPVFMSSMAIVAIAADRYRCIMQPERPQFSTNRAMILSILMAVLAIILTIPMFMYAEVRQFIEFPDQMNMADILVCQDTWVGGYKVAYTIVSSCAQFLMPFTVVIVIYLSIYMKLQKRPQSQHAENNVKRRRANYMIMAITLIFFISWLPLNVFSLIMEVWPHWLRSHMEGSETFIYAILHLFGLCNACINPVLYGYLNENFRKEYKNIYRRMPWYSTSSNHHQQAYHLQIINNADAGANNNNNLCLANGDCTPAGAPRPPGFILNRLRNGQGGNDIENDDRVSVAGSSPGHRNGAVANSPGAAGAAAYSRQCLVITTNDKKVEPATAAASLLRATKDRSLSLVSHDPAGRTGRGAAGPAGSGKARSHWSAIRRRMTLPGLGEVSVERGVFFCQNNETKLERIVEYSNSRGNSAEYDNEELKAAKQAREERENWELLKQVEQGQLDVILVSKAPSRDNESQDHEKKSSVMTEGETLFVTSPDDVSSTKKDNRSPTEGRGISVRHLSPNSAGNKNHNHKIQSPTGSRPYSPPTLPPTTTTRTKRVLQRAKTIGASSELKGPDTPAVPTSYREPGYNSEVRILSVGSLRRPRTLFRQSSIPDSSRSWHKRHFKSASVKDRGEFKRQRQGLESLNLSPNLSLQSQQKYSPQLQPRRDHQQQLEQFQACQPIKPQQHQYLQHQKQPQLQRQQQQVEKANEEVKEGERLLKNELDDKYLTPRKYFCFQNHKNSHPVDWEGLQETAV